ncbi:MAG: hypothetical protein K8L99_18160, partial [Anaerolineae bacterium]|nr:hypothetical protein [Anaerolineae bacterium]
MDQLLRFGSGDGGLKGWLYSFDPANQKSLFDNFKDLVPSTRRLLGASGGFSNYGTQALPSEVGTVNYTMWLHFYDEADGRAKLDALGEMASWGLQRLWKQPMGGGRERFCWAYLNNVNMSQKVENVPHKRMLVTITFHVPAPFWQSYPYEVKFINDGLLFDDGETAGGWTSTTYVLTDGT